MSEHLRWVRVRQELYKKVKTQVLNRLGSGGREIQDYRQAYDRELEFKWQSLQTESFLKTLDQARVVMIGDFHALKQSQKSFLRLLKNRKNKNTLTIGLECFYQNDQRHLQAWLDGEINEKEFLQRIGWKKKWGFKFENYRPILKWAQRHRHKVIGLNVESAVGGKSGLLRRDKAAAKIISECAKSSSQVYVLYGDLHLAAEHLPKQLAKIDPKLAQDLTVVHQNPERIYFQLLRKGLEHQVDVVRISKSKSFAIVSVPPWVKWQNYLLELEQSADLDIEDGLDLTDHVADHVKLLCSELGLDIDLSDLSVYSANDESFWLELEAIFKRDSMKMLEYLIEDEQSFVLPEVKRSYLGRLTVNQSSSLAMAYIHSKTANQSRTFCDFPNDFYRRVWLEAISYFGSKLVNPKRKSDTVEDMRLALISKFDAEESRDALRLALQQKMTELMVITGRGRPKPVPLQKKKMSYITAATLLGGIMGERLYNGYRKGLVSKTTLKNLLMKPLDSEVFNNMYFEIVELIESLPEPFRSKREKI